MYGSLQLERMNDQINANRFLKETFRERGSRVSYKNQVSVRDQTSVRYEMERVINNLIVKNAHSISTQTPSTVLSREDNN